MVLTWIQPNTHAYPAIYVQDHACFGPHIESVTVYRSDSGDVPNRIVVHIGIRAEAGVVSNHLARLLCNSFSVLSGVSEEIPYLIDYGVSFTPEMTCGVFFFDYDHPTDKVKNALRYIHHDQHVNAGVTLHIDTETVPSIVVNYWTGRRIQECINVGR